MKLFAKLVLALMVSMAVAAKPIGSVVALNGDATGKQPGEQSRKLVLKSEIYLADSISTTKGGRLEVMFDDNSVIAVGENSEMTIDEFVYSPADKAKKSTFTAKYKTGVFRAVSGNIAKLNPDRFKVKTRMATIGIRGSDVGSDLRGGGELHFCLQSHNPNGLTITPTGEGGLNVQQMLLFMQGMQARVLGNQAGGNSGQGFLRRLFGMGNSGPIQIMRIDPDALASFLEALEMLQQQGGQQGQTGGGGQVNADLENFRPFLIPLVPVVPMPPEPQGDGDPAPEPVSLAVGTDWELFQQVDPVTYYFTGSPLGGTQVSALRDGATMSLTGTGPFFMTVNHALGVRNLDGAIDFNINFGGGFGGWNCAISAANTLGDVFALNNSDSPGGFDFVTGEMFANGLPVPDFTLTVNGQSYTPSDFSSGSMRGNLYGSTVTGPPTPDPTGAGLNLSYTLGDGTTLIGAGAADFGISPAVRRGPIKGLRLRP